MWMCHEMMLPYVEKMRSEYHIIAPDLTGHGSDMGSFEGAEQDAVQIGKWLADHDIKTLDLIFLRPWAVSWPCILWLTVLGSR